MKPVVCKCGAYMSTDGKEWYCDECDYVVPVVRGEPIRKFNEGHAD